MQFSGQGVQQTAVALIGHGGREGSQQPGGSMQQLAQTLVPQCIGPGALPEGVRLAEHALALILAVFRRIPEPE